MNRITIRFNVTRDTPSEVQAQARQLIISALAHFVMCSRNPINDISTDDVLLISEMLKGREHDPPTPVDGGSSTDSDATANYFVIAETPLRQDKCECGQPWSHHEATWEGLAVWTCEAWHRTWFIETWLADGIKSAKGPK